MEEGSNSFKILTSKHTGKRPLERHKCKWKGNTQKDIKEISINIDSVEDGNYSIKLVNGELKLLFP